MLLFLQAVVLTHGFSRVVLALLSAAASQSGVNFTVTVTEGRPDGASFTWDVLKDGEKMGLLIAASAAFVL